MRRLTYIYAILFIMAIVFVVVNCTDEDLVKNGQENMEEFSICLLYTSDAADD